MEITSNGEVPTRTTDRTDVVTALRPPERLKHLRFPTFVHDHPKVVNVNQLADDQLTLGQKVADAVAGFVGSWPFIIGQSCVLALWLILNSVAWINHWDPYPFILLNLMLSFQAAYAAPFVMMSQNRQAEKDRLTAQNDYLTDCKGEEEIRHMMEHLDHQDALILQVVQRLEEQGERLAHQEKLTLDIVQHLEKQNEHLRAQHQEMLALLREVNPQQARLLEQMTGEESDQGQ
jgi:uncharacterized membrane protein